MANFVIVLDLDEDRRSHFIQTIRPHLAPMAGLTLDERHQDHLSVLWATAPHAPISIDQDHAGLSVIWGEAICPRSPQRQTAAALKTTWQTPPGQPYDGFYAAFTYSAATGLRVGADVMGFFPVYFWSYPGGAIVASSPELLRHHPAFTPQLSVEGLIGIMLLRTLANDHSPWQGVKRLGAGNLLTLTSDGTVAEQAQYRVPCFQADLDKAGYNRLPFEEQVDVLAVAVDQAIARHAPATDDQILLLSGGLDSRTLAGFLQRQGATPQLLTFGRNDDLEMLCAKAVAKQVGWPHQTYDAVSALAQTGDLTSAFMENAAFLTQWGHLAGSTASLTNMGWHHLAPLNLKGKFMVNGFAMDRAICGPSVVDPQFETVFNNECKGGGLFPDLARRLLVADASIQAKLDQVVTKIHQAYTQYSDVEAQRSWLLNFYHSDRFARGIGVWRFSFAIWPRVPILDQKLLAVSGQLPSQTTSRRRAQQAMVRRCFPDLARLPLDHNAFSLEPLSPSARRQRLQPLIKAQQTWWKVQKRLGYDRRPYFRSFNSNRPELQALRQQANRHRAKLADLWDLSVLDQLLPDQAVIPFGKDPIRETKRHLNLSGILLWAGENL